MVVAAVVVRSLSPYSVVSLLGDFSFDFFIVFISIIVCE